MTFLLKKSLLQDASHSIFCDRPFVYGGRHENGSTFFLRSTLRFGTLTLSRDQSTLRRRSVPEALQVKPTFTTSGLCPADQHRQHQEMREFLVLKSTVCIKQQLRNTRTHKNNSRPNHIQVRRPLPLTIPQLRIDHHLTIVIFNNAALYILATTQSKKYHLANLPKSTLAPTKSTPIH